MHSLAPFICKVWTHFVTQYDSSITFILYSFAFLEDSIPEGLILGVIQAIMTISLPSNHVSCSFQLKAQVSCALNTYEINHSHLFKTNKNHKPPLFTTNTNGLLEILTCFCPHWGQWHNRTTYLGILQKSCGCALELYGAGRYPELITNSFCKKMVMSVQSCNSPMLFLRIDVSILSPVPGNCSYGTCVLQTILLLTLTSFSSTTFQSFQRLAKAVQIHNFTHLDFHNSGNVTPHPLWWGLFFTSPFAFLLGLGLGLEWF